MATALSNKNLASIIEDLQKAIEQQDWSDQRKKEAIELVRKVKVLKNSIPKLTFFLKECGLEGRSPEERVKEIQNYVTELISGLNMVSSVIKFKEIGYERLEEFAYIGFPCTFAFTWKIV